MEGGEEQEQDTDSSDDEHTWTQQVKKKHRYAKVKKKHRYTKIKRKHRYTKVMTKHRYTKIKRKHRYTKVKRDTNKFLSQRAFCYFREVQRELKMKRREEELQKQLDPKFYALDEAPSGGKNTSKRETTEEKLKRKFKKKSLGDRLAAEQDRWV